MHARWGHAFLVLTVLVGCGSQRSSAPPRSPSVDYAPPSAQTSNGEPVGADRMAPADKLANGPRVGSDGVSGAGKPAGEPKGPAVSGAAKSPSAAPAPAK